MKMLDYALWYSEKMNFGVIPLRKNKQPFIKWFDYKERKATADEIRKWWGRWNNANIGIVTGAVSGIDVIDVDSEAGREAISEFLPETFLTPISKTVKGWHYYFKHRPGLTNQVRGGIKDCDIRTTGGYVIAPPSKNGSGIGYEWELKIKETPIEPMPDMLFDVLEQACHYRHPITPLTSELSSEHTNKEENSFSRGIYMRGEKKGVTQAGQGATMRDISFAEPGRDETLFHLANHLVKGGMPKITIEKYLEFIGLRCDPPFEKSELNLKIKSAFDRAERRSVNYTEELRELISVTSGDVSVTYACQSVTCVTKKEKAGMRKAFQRLVEEGLLEKTGRRAGEYRIIDGKCEAENWQDAEVSNVKIWLPFELDTMLEIPDGSIILFAGSQDAGKSCIMMNIAKENRHRWNTHYFSSELNAASFKNRMSKFEDVTPAMLADIKFYSRGHNFNDVIKTGDKELNIIDYLEIHDKFYMVAQHLDDIYKKLNGKGIAVVAIQKDPYKEFGRGGSFIEEKPVLSIALDRGGIATINKFKGEFRGVNPRGKQYQFKILNGSKLLPAATGEHWHTPIIIK